jgi:murein DD-endopeptidase MepM/ murein hydrolase activator NlpD
MVIQRIAYGTQGVLGGPVALAAPQVDIEQASLDMASQTPAPDVSSELSTGTLDGASSLAPETGPSQTGTGSGSLAEENRTILSAAKAVANEAKKEAKAVASRYFIQPASGRNWGELHGYNAVDISNSCGTPVLAAAAGTVVTDSDLGSGASGWNGGYGKFILLKHANGTKTRYTHLSKINVAVGQVVEQGQQIGAIGNNGHVQGATGCHLHFEVIGAPNPFARG